MTIPVSPGSSGVAANAASLFPSAASSTRSSCETAAPEMTGIGGSESESKHIARAYPRLDGLEHTDRRAESHSQREDTAIPPGKEPAGPVDAEHPAADER